MPSSVPMERVRPRALYVHIPFCVNKCGYCDFNSYAGSSYSLMESCTKATIREIELQPPTEQKIKLDTVFLGGGTPTHIPPKLLKNLLDAICKKFEFSKQLEFTVEANPESVTIEKLSILKSAGVNRISIGIQSNAQEILSFLERPHTSHDARKAIITSRKVGIDNINIDLIHSIPGLSVSLWEKTLAWALELNPTHLSCYGLTVEPKTTFFKKKQKGQLIEVEDSIQIQFLKTTKAILEQNGFNQYEISNYCKPNLECKHNLNYWSAGNYLGVGPGASKHSNGLRQTNIKGIAPYIQAINHSGNASASGETLTPRARCIEAIWLGLRLKNGADLKSIKEITGVDPEPLIKRKLRQVLNMGYCSMFSGRILLTPKGVQLADHISALLFD